jgi:GAF domain-containing protein
LSRGFAWLAWSSLSKSEIVIPVINPQNNEVLMVLDVDSEKLNFFDSIDALYLQQLAKIAANLF